MSVQDLLVSLQDPLFGDGTVGKIWGVALPGLQDTHPPTRYPEWSFGRYQTVNVDYWTAGFFPGSLYALVERQFKYPTYFPSAKIDPTKLHFAAQWWSKSLDTQTTRTDNHDLGFMIEPSFKPEYELFGTEQAKTNLITAARSLASRFNDKLGLIRSWDVAINKRYRFDDMDKDFIVIVDNMCNLDLLYLGSSLTGDPRLTVIATSHAEKTLKNHIRHPEWSTYHMMNYDQQTGVPKGFTNQGYADDSTWARGQSWGVLGYAQTYYWTKKPEFLDASQKLAEYYLSRLPEDGVPPWDFDSPEQDVKDVSSAMVVALGMLINYSTTKDESTLKRALQLVKDCVDHSYANKAVIRDDGTVELGEYDTILKNSTTQNNVDSVKKWKNHGLVYADYYFLLIGNKLLELGLYKT